MDNNGGWATPAGTVELPQIDPWFFDIEGAEYTKAGVTVPSAAELAAKEDERNDAAAALRSIVRAAGSDGIEPRKALAELAALGFVYAPKGKRIKGLRRRAGIAVGWGRGSRWTVTR